MASPEAREERTGPFVRTLRASARWLGRIPRPVSWVTLALWMGVIWALSSRPGSGGPARPPVAFLANLFHAPLFGLLALWAALVLARRDATGGTPRVDGRAAVGAVLVALAWGVIDELHQSRVPERDASAGDVVTDVVAACATVWVASYVTVGSPSEQGVVRRLAGGVVACALAALVATL